MHGCDLIWFENQIPRLSSANLRRLPPAGHAAACHRPQLAIRQAPRDSLCRECQRRQFLIRSRRDNEARLQWAEEIRGTRSPPESPWRRLNSFWLASKLARFSGCAIGVKLADFFHVTAKFFRLQNVQALHAIHLANLHQDAAAPEQSPPWRDALKNDASGF